MKPPLFAALTLSLLSLGARADFNLDAKEGAIHCTGSGVKLTVSPDRSKMTVEGKQAGTYAISQDDSDGDTYVAYKSGDGKLTISFDDRGDTLFVNASNEQIGLRCK